MNIALLKAVVKWVWLCVIFVFVAVYANKKQDVLAEMISAVPLSSILWAGCAIAAAKTFLMLNMKISSRRFGIEMGAVESFRVYNLTQLAKYIPGSIWQFVGRASIYKDKGHSLTEIRDSLIAEHFWLVGGAFVIGAFCILSSAPNPVTSWALQQDWKLVWFVVLGSAFSVMVLGVLSYRYQAVRRWAMMFIPPVGVVGCLTVTWLALGASLWVLTGPFSEEPLSYLYLVGVYGIAFGLGFLVPFAPAGLGVREVVFVIALANDLDADAAIMIAAINRVLYFVVEVLLGVLSMFLKENN